LSVGDEAGARLGAGAGAGAGEDDWEGGGAGGNTGGRDCAATAPPCLTGRAPADGFVFAGLEWVAGLTGAGVPVEVSGLLGGVALWSVLVLVDGSASLGGAAGGGGFGGAETGGTEACVTSRPALGDTDFMEAQPETARITRNPAITGGCIDGSIGMPGDPTPCPSDRARL